MFVKLERLVLEQSKAALWSGPDVVIKVQTAGRTTLSSLVNIRGLIQGSALQAAIAIAMDIDRTVHCRMISQLSRRRYQ